MCAVCLQTMHTYNTTYASVLVFSGAEISETINHMHDTARKKTKGNLNSYCRKCRVITANVDITQTGTENLIDYHKRSKQFKQYESFSARMPSKRTLSRRVHLTSTLKSKARKNHVSPVDTAEYDGPRRALTIDDLLDAAAVV